MFSGTHSRANGDGGFLLWCSPHLVNRQKSCIIEGNKIHNIQQLINKNCLIFQQLKKLYVQQVLFCRCLQEKMPISKYFGHSILVYIYFVFRILFVCVSATERLVFLNKFLFANDSMSEKHIFWMLWFQMKLNCSYSMATYRAFEISEKKQQQNLFLIYTTVT